MAAWWGRSGASTRVDVCPLIATGGLCQNRKDIRSTTHGALLGHYLNFAQRVKVFHEGLILNMITGLLACARRCRLCGHWAYSTTNSYTSSNGVFYACGFTKVWIGVMYSSSTCAQWNLALTPPYLTPSTINSNTNPALSIRISSVKSKLSNSTPLVVVSLVNKLLGTVFRSVVSVHTLIRPLRNDSGATSASHAMRSSSTTSDWPGRKLRV